MLFRKRYLLHLAIIGWIILALGLNPTDAQTETAPPNPIHFDFKNVDNNPILEPGEAGQWDAVSVRFPNVVVYEDKYYLFYGTFQNMTAPVAIGYADSDDGIHWTKYDENPILKGSGSGFDAFGVTRPVVMVEPDGTWVLYYNGIPSSNKVFGTAIGRATASSPGGPWTRDTTPVLEVGSAGQWDTPFLFPDSVVKDDDQYVLYYSSGFMIGRATSSDGIQWTKYNDPATTENFSDSDPVLKLGAANAWDSQIAWGSSVQHTSNGWEMFYYGSNSRGGGPNIKIGYASSADGIIWAKYPDPIIGFDDREAFFPSVLVNDDSTYNVYYAVTPGNTATSFYLATGTVTRAG